MSTHTEKPPVQPSRPNPHHDEFGGPFGFFRKYQKLILYTAGIFALVTFSITTSVTQFFRNISVGSTGPMPTIEVLGRKVALEPEDLRIGSFLARHQGATYVLRQPRVLPPIGQGSLDTDLGTCFAILRRVSITLGLDVSMTEVDRAVDWIVHAWNSVSKRSDSKSQLALAFGMGSLSEYEDLVKEAMRIGNLVRLTSIGVDMSDVAAMNQLIEGQEKIAVRAAIFDKKAREEQLKAESKVADADLHAWFDKLDDKAREPLQVYDTNKVSLALGVVRLAEFKADEWAAELAEFKFGEEQQKKLYEAEKARRFKGEKEGEFKPLADAAVQDELRRIAQVDEVLNGVLGKLRERLQAALKAPTEELGKAAAEKTQFQKDRDAAKAASAARPDDQELAQKLRQAEEALVAKEKAETDAKDALAAARQNFDFRGQFLELVKDKDGKRRAGCAVVDVAGPKNAKELEDLGADLGAWDNPKLATNLQNVGELGTMPARATKAGFLFQVTKLDVRPLKPWDEIKAKVEEAYYIDKARQVGETQKQAFEAALLRLGKEKIPDQVAAIEGRKAGEVDKRFTAWEAKVRADLDRAKEWLGKLSPGSQVYASYEKLRDDSQVLLDKKDDKRHEIEALVGKDLEAEVAAAAKKQYGAVLEAAAKEAGFTVASFGPYKRRLSLEPWFQKRFDKAVTFLWGGPVNDLKAGEVTDVLEDNQNRRLVLAACDDVKPLEWSDVSRREFAGKMAYFGEAQVSTAVRQAFTLEALKERYHYEQPAGKQIVDQGGGPKKDEKGGAGKPGGNGPVDPKQGGDKQGGEKQGGEK